jgi:hypothetical protein
LKGRWCSLAVRAHAAGSLDFGKTARRDYRSLLKESLVLDHEEREMVARLLDFRLAAARGSGDYLSRYKLWIGSMEELLTPSWLVGDKDKQSKTEIKLDKEIEQLGASDEDKERLQRMRNALADYQKRKADGSTANPG